MGRDAELRQLSELVEEVQQRLDRIQTISGGETWAAGGSTTVYDAIYRQRRIRDEVFAAPGLFGEPAWDILLGLARAEALNKSSSVTSLCVDSCVPPTTALRYVSELENKGIIERVRDTMDGRRFFLRLTANGREKMRQYVAKIKLFAEDFSKFTECG